MRLAAKLCLVVFILWAGIGTTCMVLANYHYDKDIGGYWSLSVKASTIYQKSQYLDKFVGALERAELDTHDAVWLKTPDNSREHNLITLKSLQSRMHEIIKMDVSSFTYQQAMHQITGQEQDEAHHMLGRLEGLWFKRNHFLLWDWVGFLNLFAAYGGSVISGIFLIATSRSW